MSISSHLCGNICFGNILKYILELRISDVHQHVSVGAVFHSHVHVIILTTVVVFNSFLFCAP